jgi:hypothetical protein
MISFDVGSHRFQLRAAAVFVWNGHVLLHRLEQDEFWALGDSALLDASRSHFGREGQQTLEFRWFTVSALDGVDLRPSFLKSALAKSPAAFEHVVQHE